MVVHCVHVSYVRNVCPCSTFSIDPNGYQGLSKRGGRHYTERTKCLNDFRPFYKNGKIPLYYTQTKITHQLRSYYRRKRL